MSFVHPKNHEGWSKISGTKFSTEKLLIAFKWEPCTVFCNIWCCIPEEQVAGWYLAQGICPLQCEVDVLERHNLIKFCWKLEKCPQKHTGCYATTSIIENWVDPRQIEHYSYFKNGWTSSEKSGKCRTTNQTYSCLQDSSAMPVTCSSSEVAS